MSDVYSHMTHRCSCGREHDVTVVYEAPIVTSIHGSNTDTVWEASDAAVKVTIKEQKGM